MLPPSLTERPTRFAAGSQIYAVAGQRPEYPSSPEAQAGVEVPTRHRGWSQGQAADHWNARWPDDPKSFKNFSYWELWPASTGHAPSLDVLARLAELYECGVADLVSDCPDFCHTDAMFRLHQQMPLLEDPASSQAFQDLVTQLDHIDVNELAHMAAVWAHGGDNGVSRRSLLLKLSAALSLASANSVLTAETRHAAAANWGEGNYSGIWHSRYVYPSSGRGESFSCEHYLVPRQQGARLIGQSLPHTSGSQLKIEMATDQSVATGTWRERTAPAGCYHGAAYHGTFQLFLDPSGRSMKGMWLGFGHDFTINSGEWRLTCCDDRTSKNAQREYSHKT